MSSNMLTFYSQLWYKLLLKKSKYSTLIISFSCNLNSIHLHCSIVHLADKKQRIIVR